jgi:Tfp pilus assembly protein PilF
MSADAELALRRMLVAQQDAPGPWLQLTALLEQDGRLPEAEACYRQLLDRLPKLPVARFNFACFLRRRGRLEEALQLHRQALDLGIDQPEEVLSNMGVICSELHRDQEARSLLERALELNPSYIPAMYNLALQQEECGDREGSLELFNRILEQDPSYYNALIHIAHAQPVRDPADPLIRKLRRALRRSRVDELTRESLHFALGKVLDDCGLYDLAFEQFEYGNRRSAGRLQAYDRRLEEQRTAEIEQLFSADWLASVVGVSDRPLVFVTGLFRSGSTLIEQVLAGHPRVTAGGEIDYFHRELARLGAPFPQSLAETGQAGLQQLGAGYLDYLDRTFPQGDIVTNKRPDAFGHLGLLKALFPRARFVNTVRNPLDTCLSIYFQQLDDRVAYANDLENIAHHFLQYRRLMSHWQQLFGDCILDVSYDDFVGDRVATTRALLQFLDLEWDDGCLDFPRRDNRVRTASVWQVREPVYRKSSGRWQHYERQLEPARRMLAGASV